MTLNRVLLKNLQDFQQGAKEQRTFSGDTEAIRSGLEDDRLEADADAVGLPPQEEDRVSNRGPGSGLVGLGAEAGARCEVVEIVEKVENRGRGRFRQSQVFEVSGYK